MKREIKHPEKLLSTGSYSAAVECDGWVFVSGYAAQNLATGEVVHGTIAEETRLTLSHIGTVLAQAGCTFADVVKCTCHLADIDTFEEFDKTYREFFTVAYSRREPLGNRCLATESRSRSTPSRVCHADDRSLWHQGVWRAR